MFWYRHKSTEEPYLGMNDTRPDHWKSLEKLSFNTFIKRISKFIGFKFGNMCNNSHNGKKKSWDLCTYFQICLLILAIVYKIVRIVYKSENCKSYFEICMIFRLHRTYIWILTFYSKNLLNSFSNSTLTSKTFLIWSSNFLFFNLFFIFHFNIFILFFFIQ